MNPHNHHQQQPLAPLVIVNSSSSTSSSSSSANSLLKTRFALRFLQSLKKINNSRHRTTNHSPTSSLPSSSHPKKSNLITTRKRSKRVKIAADASMASLIGSRRVWSRAVISNLRRNHTTSTTLMKTAPDAQKLKKIKIKKKKKKMVGLRKRKVVVASGGGGRENQLRNLVPGGNEMDSCTLLDETAHYIQCLATQVMVMRNIVDYCSPSPP